MNINFGGFGGFDFNSFENLQEQCEIEVTLGDTIIEKSSLPVVFARNQFMQMVKQLSQDSRPIKIVCYRKEYTDEGLELQNSLIFKNNSYIKAFGEN